MRRRIRTLTASSPPALGTHTMECCNRQDVISLQQSLHHGRRASVYHNPLHSPWFDTRVFYIRVTNFTVEDSTPDHLTLTYIPMGLDTVVRVKSSGGGRSTSLSDGCVSTQLRRDRADKGTDEVTFVSTDGIHISGTTVCFEVCGAEDELLLSGVLETVLSKGNRVNGEGTRWAIRCESHKTAARRVMKAGRRRGTAGTTTDKKQFLPTIDVYVAGTDSGNPVVLTDTLHLLSTKHYIHKKPTLDAIPEQEHEENSARVDAMQLPDFRHHVKQKQDDSFSPKRTMYDIPTDHFDYMASKDDGELSWFNAGVRVGVGISLGVCVGVGLGVGLLVTSYQTSARNLKRRFF